MRELKFIFIILAVIVVISDAHISRAADLYDPYPRRAYTDQPADNFSYPWTGLYLGVHGGYAFGDSTSENKTAQGNGDGFDDGAATSLSLDPEGFSGGFQIGYNLQDNNLVLGFETEAGYMAADDKTLAENFADTSYRYYGVVAGRLGYAADKYLIYFKGGLALADIETEASDVEAGVIDASDFTRSDDVRVGYAIGAGLEHAFEQVWTFKVEYLFMDFEDDDSTNTDGDVFTHQHEIHSVKFGINHRF
ncbi:MAG: outer membrane beta-barrel protein [Pseudomonadota bacterium]